MKKLIVAVILFTGLLLTIPGQAAEFISPDKGMGEGNVNLPAGQTHHNLYVAGGNVNVNSETTGDLFAAGGVVNASARVEQDLTAAGGTVVVNGPVGGDARLAGGNISINAGVTGDVLVAGGNINLSTGAAVAGDLIAAGGNVDVAAPVNGKAWITGETVLINSTVTGEVRVNAQKLTFGPNSVVTGKIIYKGQQEAEIQEGANVSTIEFTRVEAKSKVRGLFTLAFLIKLLATFIVAWLLYWYRGARVHAVLETTTRSPLMSLLIGCVALIITPILVVLLFVTLVGFYLAILVLLAYLFLLAISWALTAIYMGSLLIQWYSKTDHMEINWKSIVLGVLVMEILTWIPVIGALIGFILMLMVFGSIIRMLKPTRPNSTEPVVVASEPAPL